MSATKFHIHTKQRAKLYFYKTWSLNIWKTNWKTKWSATPLYKLLTSMYLTIYPLSFAWCVKPPLEKHPHWDTSGGVIYLRLVYSLEEVSSNLFVTTQLLSPFMSYNWVRLYFFHTRCSDTHWTILNFLYFIPVILIRRIIHPMWRWREN